MPKRTVLLALLLFALGAAAQVSTLPVPFDLKAELAPTMGPMPAVLLTWKAEDGFWGYTIYRSEADTGHFARIGVSRTKMFIDPRVAPGVLYFYRVCSAATPPDSQFVESAPSAMVRFMIPPPPRLKGEIVGKVVDDATGKPIFGAPIRFFYRGPSIAIYPPPTATTDTAGIYRAVLDTGSYLIRAESPVYRNCRCPGYVPEWYDDVQEIRLATPVQVIPNASVRANFGLARVEPPKLVTIEGTVTNDVGMLTVLPTPLRGATVVIMRPVVTATNAEEAGEELRATVDALGFCPGIIWKGVTDSLGRYAATVPAGRAYIAVASMRGYLPEYYKEKTNPLQADVIKADDNITGIDFTLARNPVFENSVAGRVRDSLGNGVPSRIILFPLTRKPPAWTMIAPAIRVGHTDSAGAYVIEKVPAGKYFVLAVPFRGYFPAFYKEGMYGVWNWQKADTVLIDGHVTGIDVGVVKLIRCGTMLLTGQIRRNNGDPIDGARILVHSLAGEFLGFGVSDASGSYAVENLPQVPMSLSFDMEGYLPGEKTITPEPNDLALSAGVVQLDEIMTDIIVTPAVPETFRLHQNYPNPFNPSTTITYDMSGPGVAKLAVYNILGQEIATLLEASVQPGRRTVVWNGTDKSGKPAGSGIYLIRFTASDQSGGRLHAETRKMMLVR